MLSSLLLAALVGTALAFPTTPSPVETTYNPTQVAELASACFINLDESPDGAGVAFRMGADDVTASDHTVTFWFKADDPVAATGPLITATHPEADMPMPYQISLNKDGAVVAHVPQPGANAPMRAFTSSLAVADSDWHFVAVTLSRGEEGTEAVIAVDGDVYAVEESEVPKDNSIAARGARGSTHMAELFAWGPPLSTMQLRVVYTASSNRQLCPTGRDGGDLPEPCDEDDDKEEDDGLAAADTDKGMDLELDAKPEVTSRDGEVRTGAGSEDEDEDELAPLPVAARQPPIAVHPGPSSSTGIVAFNLKPPTVKPPAAEAAHARMPQQLLRCLHAVTVGVEVLDEDGTTAHMSKTNTIITEELVPRHAGLTDDCAAVVAGARRVMEAAGRTFDTDSLAMLAADAYRAGDAHVDKRPHTHLFQLARGDPQLLDDATQVLVMGIMAGMVASVSSLMVGLGVGCWAAASLAKASRTKRAKDMI